MSAAIFARGMLEHWRGFAVTAAGVGAMLFLGLYIYQGIDLSIYDALPEAVRAVMGIPEHADASVMAYNEMLAAIGALAFTGVSLGMGAACVTADEEAGRASLILATPTSRVRFAVSRALAFVAAVILGGTALWGIAEVAPIVLSVDTGDAHVGALMTHLVASGLFHGSLAFAIALTTGRRALGSGIAATVMVGGWLGSGLLPLWREGAADWVPWTWFNGSKPLVNGIERGHLALLLGGALVLLALGVVAFALRELRTRVAVPGLRERLQAIPGVARIVRPTGRGASLFTIRLAAHQVLVGYVTVLGGLVMGLAMPPIYNVLMDAVGSFAVSFPQSMADLFGGGDLTTPAGFLHLETFGMVAPLCVILVATAASSAGIAGEERAGRLSVLLAQPIGRTRIYLTVALTSAVYSLIVAGVLFLGTWAGIALAGIDVSVGNLAATCLLLLLLGWFFGALALLLSAATGRPGAAVWVTTVVAVVGYFGYTLLLAAGRPELGIWSPFAAYLNGPVLAEGMRWWQPVWLGLGALILLLAGLPVWLRRDIRSARG